MRHFMAQFGPALQWPWTKLMDVPELTDELLDRIVAQSDAQAAGRSVRELEALRDDCLVAVLQGLRSVGVGAGRGAGPLRADAVRPGRPWPATELRDGEPLVVDERIRARPSGSTTTATPTTAATWSCPATASTPSCASSASTRRYLAVGPLLLHRREPPHLPRSRAGPATGSASTSSLLDHDDEAPPRLHADVPARRRRLDVLMATAEHMLLHVDTVAGRAVPADSAVLDRLERWRPPTPASPVRTPRRPLREATGPDAPGPASRQRTRSCLAIPRRRGDAPRPEHGLLDLLRRRARQRVDDVDVAREHVAGHALARRSRSARLGVDDRRPGGRRRPP